jgi:hypothetical protein
MLKLKGRNVCERALQFSLRKCRQFGKALRLSIKTLVTTDGFSGDAEDVRCRLHPAAIFVTARQFAFF